MISLSSIYIMLLIGIGGLALLSQKIIVDALNKYKIFDIVNRLNSLFKNESSKKENQLIELNSNIKEIDIKKYNKKIKDIQKGINNKFEFFFIICVVTTFGYLGKYLINLIIDVTLKNLFGVEYKKIYYFLNIIILYFISFLFSIIIYLIFYFCFFTEREKEEKEKNKYSVCQICGYIIYSENVIIEKENNPLNDANLYNNHLNEHPSKCKKCLKSCRELTKLYCESTKHCCDEVCCSFFRFLINLGDQETTHAKYGEYSLGFFSCWCCCCRYEEEDYKKKKEFFCYCYQKERKSYRCDKFFTNDTQKIIVPYMIVYFFLQLTTIAFEQMYEEKKNHYNYGLTSVIVFLLSFFFFFYFNISLSRCKKRFMDDDKVDLFLEGNELIFNKSKIKDDNVHKISSKTIDGTFSILLFNGVFSLIFSCIYLFHKSNKYTENIFEKNMNIIFIPILMNKFYYFTLNYYYTYTSEVNKKFDVFASSTLIAMYLLVYDLIIWLIKRIISLFTIHYYFRSLIIIQIISSIIPSLIVVGYIIWVYFIIRPYVKFVSLDAFILSD